VETVTTDDPAGSRIGVALPAVDGGAFVLASPRSGVNDTDLLGIVLGGIALLMFATGLILVLQ